MSKTDLLSFLRSHRYAVQASVSPSLSPQAAVVGIAVSDSLEVIFDTIESTQKAKNLRSNAKIALVVGGLDPGDERTVQLRGIADEPEGAELSRVRQVYYGQFPDGPSRLSWPGLIYVRVRPTWIRYCDYNKDPAEIIEMDSEVLRSLR